MDNLNPELEKIITAMKARAEQTTHSSETPSPMFECEACKDTGMILAKDDEGRLIAMECKCWAARHARDLIKRSGLEEAIELQTFDNFVCNTPLQSRIKRTAERYVDDLLTAISERSPRKPWMYIGGNPGAGKTHICTAVCGELLKKGIGVRYMQWLNAAPRLKYRVDDEDYDNQISTWVNAPVLYIDDLLKQKYAENPRFTEADIRVAFSILDARYIQNMPTIISSEWDLLDHLLSADEAVFSRVYERCKGYTVIIDRKKENNFRLTGGLG